MIILWLYPNRQKKVMRKWNDNSTEDVTKLRFYSHAKWRTNQLSNTVIPSAPLLVDYTDYTFYSHFTEKDLINKLT